MHSKTRHGFFRAKRRVLILTDLPRLICVKEHAEHPAGGLASSSSSAGGSQRISVKSEVYFPNSTASRPSILHKITERSGEANLDEDEEFAEIPSASPSHHRNPSRSTVDSEVEGSSGTVLHGVEAKGDKSFIIVTVSGVGLHSKEFADLSYVRRIAGEDLYLHS